MKSFRSLGVLGIAGIFALTGCGSDGEDPPVDPPVENRAPTANAGLDQSVKVGDAVSLDGSQSTDPDKDTLTFKWSVKSQPQGSAIELKDATAKTSFTPQKAGIYEIQLTVSDGKLEAPDTLKITVSEKSQNGKPVAKIEPTPARALAKAEVALDGSTSSDPDKDALTHKWTLKKPDGSSATIAGTADGKAKFTPDVAGEYAAELIVNDGKADSDAVSAKINVVAKNEKPVANAGITEARALVNADLVLDPAKSTDADNDKLTYTWKIKEPADAKAKLTPDGDKVKFKAEAAGVYKVELIANDGIVASDPVVVTITVKADNKAPVAKAGNDQTVAENADVALDGSASADEDTNDTLTFAWKITKAPEGSNAKPTDATKAKTSFKADKKGEFEVELEVSDGIVSHKDTLKVTVN